ERLLHGLRRRELAHADRGRLGGRDAQRHLVLGEVDYEQLELEARDFLLFDPHDLANAVGRINNAFVRPEALTAVALTRGGCGLLARHWFLRSFARTWSGRRISRRNRRRYNSGGAVMPTTGTYRR